MDTKDDKPAKKKSKLLLLVIGALVLGGGGFGGYTFLKGSQSNAVVIDPKAKPGEPGSAFNADGTPRTPPAASKPIHRQVIIREPSVVNLRETLGAKYLKIRMGFEITNDAVVTELTELDAPLNDYISEKLSNTHIKELDSIAGRNKLKRELLIGINELLKKGIVEKIYFTEFVIQ